MNKPEIFKNRTMLSSVKRTTVTETESKTEQNAADVKKF